MRFLLRL